MHSNSHHSSGPAIFGKHPVSYCLFLIAVLLFGYLVRPDRLSQFYEAWLILPCVLAFSLLAFSGKGSSSRSISRLAAAMGLWCFLLQVIHAFGKQELLHPSLYLSSCLFAFPLAGLLPEKQSQKALSWFAGIWLAASAVLALYVGLLVLDQLPACLSGNVYWSGDSLYAFWHANLLACLFLAGIVFCAAFLSTAKKAVCKAGLFLLLPLLLGGLMLTNCQTVILLACLFLGSCGFCAFLKKHPRRILPASVAALLLAAALFTGCSGLFQLRRDSLLEYYTARYYAMQTGETDTYGGYYDEYGDYYGDPEAELPIAVDYYSDEISLEPYSGPVSFANIFWKLRQCSEIWSCLKFAIRDDPRVLLWGTGDPGAFLSPYGETDIVHTHNAWLECLLGQGIPGLILAAVMSLWVLWNGVAVLLRQGMEPWKRSTALLAIGLMAASVMEPYIFHADCEHHPVQFLFFLCAGYLAHWQEGENRRLLAALRCRFPF